ncbi:phage tail tape measure protein [Clostridium grantii]|uniref:Phage tail tape measure protein, TP901 family, core region n=1 Tax=Clostridium grantii DSM 8605 TaxID=1121316 RepID=A0A1M5U9N1_9CLOT|nr:phage tail tape measure protein [Clostridium grantii]SHH59403.1 phage tail tape measure protein, TP901 family, core region [Clostridium grantii DSM 8605]
MATGENTVVARIGLDDKGFQEGVAKIQRSLKVVKSEFAAASSKLGDFGKSTDGLKLKADSLTQQMELQKQKVAALSKSYQESVEKKGEDAKATENLKIKLNYAIAEMNNMEGAISDINKQIEVQSSGFTKLGKNFEDIGSRMKKVGEGFSSVGSTLDKTVTAPIVAAGAGLFKLASDFDEASDSIRIGTGATGEALEGLEQDFKAVYTTVDTSMGDASKVIADLNTRTGLSGESLQELSTQMLRLAKVTGEDINTLIPASTRMFQDAGLGADEYAGALDYTFKVSQSTGIGVGKLQELMTQFGGPLRQMGFDWQTSAAMLGKFEKEGVNTELVVGSLRIALGKMAKEGISEPNKALQEMITRIKEAGTAGEANTLALEMFGAKAGPDMAAAIREGRLNLDELINSLNSSPETIAQVYTDTADAAEQFVVLKNKMAVALEPLGKKLFEAVNNAMPTIEKLIQAIIGIIEKFNALSPVQQDMILKFALVAAAIGPVLSVVGTLISAGGTLFSTFGSISTALGAAGGASGALGTAFAALTGPVAIIIAAIVGLIAIFVTLYKNNEDFRNVVNATWNEVKVIIGTIIESLKVMFQAFITFAMEVWSKYGDDIVAVITIAFGFIADIVKTTLNAIQDVIQIVTALIKGDWQGVWDGIKNLTSDLWTGIKNAIEAGLDLIKSVISIQMKFIEDSISGVWNGIKTVTSNVWNGIKTAIETPINTAKDTVKSAVDSIHNFFANLKIPEINIPKIKLPHFNLKGSFSLDPPSVPSLNVDWYASGGIFNAPSVIGVGESGTEAVLPIDRLDEILARALEKVKGGSSSSGLTLHIENFINNTEKDIEQLAYELEFYRQRVAMAKGGS